MKKKFQAAFKGLILAFKHRAVSLQLLLALITLICAFIFKLTALELLIIVVMIAMVVTAEIFNTAIEKLCDLVDPHYNPQIGLIKDLAAGAVLCSALAALAVGLIIFGKKIGG